MIVATRLSSPKSRQFIAWKPSNRDPSRRERCDPNPGLIRRPDRSTPVGPNHTVPYGTVPVIAQIPGNKLPGYDHLVPPGQSPTGPSGQIQSYASNQNRVSPASFLTTFLPLPGNVPPIQ